LAWAKLSGCDISKISAAFHYVPTGVTDKPSDLLDEAALIEALQNGVIGGAGLDVFEAEPNVPEALRAMPHVVLAPHIGSATSQTRQAMADLAFNNLKSHFDGHAVHTPVPECAHKG
jgi:lactate dehydrogenase-like 2-hydroxyacid dehydrogenase